MWDASKCDLCGDCLVNCRYTGYDRDGAIAQITLLMEGKDAATLLALFTILKRVRCCKPTRISQTRIVKNINLFTTKMVLVIYTLGQSPLKVKRQTGYKPFPVKLGLYYSVLVEIS